MERREAPDVTLTGTHSNAQFLAGRSVRISAEVEDDVFVAGRSVTFDGAKVQNAIVAGNAVTFERSTARDMIALAGRMTVAGEVQDDLVTAARWIRIVKDGSIGGDARLAARDIELKGKISGSVRAIARRITVSGMIDGKADLMAEEKELGLSDGGKILLKTTHVWFGYVFAVNFWRIAWAFLGNRHANWSAIIPFHKGYGAAVKAYMHELFCGDVRPYLGHNPIARASVSILLILLILQAVTGLVLAGTDIYYPPFGRWIADWIAALGVDPSTIAPYDRTGIDPGSWEAMRSFRSVFLTIHFWNFYALLAVIAIHITGVVVTELREGGGIVSAMFTGRKVFDREPRDDMGAAT